MVNDETYIDVAMREFIGLLDDILPAGRAKSVAITHAQTAALWARQALTEAPDPR